MFSRIMLFFWLNSTDAKTKRKQKTASEEMEESKLQKRQTEKEIPEFRER